MAVFIIKLAQVNQNHKNTNTFIVIFYTWRKFLDIRSFVSKILNLSDFFV